MSQAKKILHIAGGVSIQKLYQHIFSEFSERGILQDVYVPCNTASKVGKNKIDLPNLTYCFKAVGNLVDRVLFFPKIRKHFTEIENAFNVDSYSYCFAYTVMTDGSLAYRLKKKEGTHYSVFVRNTDINIFYRYFFWLRPFFRRILINAEFINFPNPSYETRIRSMMGVKFVAKIESKIRIVPNGIDNFWHEHRILNPKQKINHPVRLIFVGKIDENKNVDGLIRAIRILRNKGEYKLMLIGLVSQDKKEDLEKWREELKDKLIYAGEVANNNLLLEYYRQADIFVMPSKTETFGLVYIEALTQGLPILYTKGEGVSGFFDNKHVGLAIDNPEDEVEIAEKITKISDNYCIFAKDTITESIRFNWREIINLYITQTEGHEKV